MRLDLLRLTLALALTVFGFVSVQPLECQNYSGKAIDLLRSMYPELKGQKLNILILDQSRNFDVPWRGSSNSFAILLTRDQVNLEEPTFPCLTPVLYASYIFEVTGQKRLFHLGIEDPSGRSRLNVIRKEVDSHPDWSDGEIIQKLAAAGAKFGPDSKVKLIRTLPVDALAQVIGKFKILESKFKIRRVTDSPDDTDTAQLVWVVYLRTLEARSRRYFLMIEPFGGKIVSIGAIPGRN